MLTSIVHGGSLHHCKEMCAFYTCPEAGSLLTVYYVQSVQLSTHVRLKFCTTPLCVYACQLSWVCHTQSTAHFCCILCILPRDLDCLAIDAAGGQQLHDWQRDFAVCCTALCDWQKCTPRGSHPTSQIYMLLFPLYLLLECTTQLFVSTGVDFMFFVLVDAFTAKCLPARGRRRLPAERCCAA